MEAKGWSDSLRGLEQGFRRWVAADPDSPESARALELFGDALLELTVAHRDAVDRLAQVAPRSLLVALQRVGRLAFRALVAGQVRDENRLKELRGLSSRLLSAFRNVRDSIERSDLYSWAIEKLLRRVETGWPDFADAERVDRYLVRTMRHVLIDLHRARKAGGQVGSLTEVHVEPAAPEPSPPAVLESKDAARRVEAWLEVRLRAVQPPALRVVCELHLRHGVPFAELARHWDAIASPTDPPRNLEARRKHIARTVAELTHRIRDAGERGPESTAL